MNASVFCGAPSTSNARTRLRTVTIRSRVSSARNASGGSIVARIAELTAGPNGALSGELTAAQIVVLIAAQNAA